MENRKETEEMEILREKERVAERAAKRSLVDGLEGFQRFWEAYPRITAKDMARRSWLKIFPDGVESGEVVDAIIAGVERHKKTRQWTKNGGEFIPHASTFLNQRRWEDSVKEGEPTTGIANNVTTKRGSERFVVRRTITIKTTSQ